MGTTFPKAQGVPIYRVMIVDDQEGFRQEARRLLEGEAGFEVVGEAASGEEAVELAPKLNPELVLMDVHLGGMNGVGATRLLLQRCPQARVVLVSFFPDKEYLRLARQVGAIGFIPKAQFTLERLQQLLSQVPEGPSG